MNFYAFKITLSASSVVIGPCCFNKLAKYSNLFVNEEPLPYCLAFKALPKASAAFKPLPFCTPPLNRPVTTFVNWLSDVGEPILCFVLTVAISFPNFVSICFSLIFL